MGHHTSPRTMVLLVAVLLHLAGTGAIGTSLGGLFSAELFTSSNSIAALAPTVIMADNFTTASGMAGRLPEHVGTSPWNEVSGRWLVRNGYLDPPNSANALVLYPAARGDLRVEVAVVITSAYQFGLVVRGTGAGPSYLIASISTSGQAVIAKTVSGTRSVLATAPFTAPVGPFTLSLEAVGGSLELRSDGVLVVAHVLTAANAAAFASLTDAGLWVSSSGNERLDDFRITTVA